MITRSDRLKRLVAFSVLAAGAAYGLAASFVDNFSGNTINTSVWDVSAYAGGSVVQKNGRLKFSAERAGDPYSLAGLTNMKYGLDMTKSWTVSFSYVLGMGGAPVGATAGPALIMQWSSGMPVTIDSGFGLAYLQVYKSRQGTFVGYIPYSPFTAKSEIPTPVPYAAIPSRGTIVFQYNPTFDRMQIFVNRRLVTTVRDFLETFTVTFPTGGLVGSEVGIWSIATITNHGDSAYNYNGGVQIDALNVSGPGVVVQETHPH
jgi:hypothetical protein